MDRNCNNMNDIIKLIKRTWADIENRFTVKRRGLFGSFVTSEERPDRDVDITVALREPTFDHYMECRALFNISENKNGTADE